MKLIDIMKRYNKCILKENAKLRSIYNTLIRECDGADAENECDVSECGDKEENERDTNEAEGTKMSIAEFLGECGKENCAKEGATDECDACGDDSCKNGEKCGLKEGEDSADDPSKKEQIDEVNDGDLMTAEEFFGGKKKGGAGDKDETEADECDACGDDSCKNGEKCGLKEGEDEIDEDEELISKKEFYATNESDNEDKTNEDEEIDEEVEEEITDEAEEIDEDEEIDEAEEETNEDEDTENDVTESKKDNKETELSESLEDHYRAANRKLFNI